MSCRGNPYDNAIAEGLMKTPKVEGVYPMAFETFGDVAEQLPRFIEKYNDRRPHSALGYRSPAQFGEENPGTRSKPQPDICPPRGPTPRTVAKLRLIGSFMTAKSPRPAPTRKGKRAVDHLRIVQRHRSRAATVRYRTQATGTPSQPRSQIAGASCAEHPDPRRSHPK